MNARFLIRVIGFLVAVFPAAAGSSAFAGVALELDDGRVLRGDSVEAVGDLLVLINGGDRVILPRELVVGMALFNEAAVEDAPEADVIVTPPDAGQAAAPDGAADERDEMPRRPLDAFRRPPATFVRPPLDTRWRFDSVIGRETEVTNFNPVIWYRPPTEFRWRPDASWQEAEPLFSMRARGWYRPPVTTRWSPRDGFAPTTWFAPVAPDRD